MFYKCFTYVFKLCKKKHTCLQLIFLGCFEATVQINTKTITPDAEINLLRSLYVSKTKKMTTLRITMIYMRI